eukprot:2228222-Rhodomonas_salina.1
MDELERRCAEQMRAIHEVCAYAVARPCPAMGGGGEEELWEGMKVRAGCTMSGTDIAHGTICLCPGSTVPN